MFQCGHLGKFTLVDEGKGMSRKKKVSTAKSLLLTIPEVAIKLNICCGTVYNLIHHEGSPTIMFRGLRRVHPDLLQKWLAEYEKQAA